MIEINEKVTDLIFKFQKAFKKFIKQQLIFFMLTSLTNVHILLVNDALS